MLNCFNPLDQFIIYLVLKPPVYNLYFINSLLTYLVLLGLYIFRFQIYNFSLLNKFNILFNFIIRLVKILFLGNFAINLVNFFIIFLIFIFYYICIINLLGMIPYTFTTTSHIIITFQISFFFFFGLNIIGFIIHGLILLTLFIISGIPQLIKPFLTVIEVISYLARVFSLAIRLFANVMAGHTLLAILTDFVWSMLINLGLSLLLTVVPFIIICSVTTLELSISFLQAYVFVLLLTIYIRDVVFLH